MKKYFIGILILAMSMAVYAEQRTEQEAANIAAGFAKSQLAPAGKKGMRRANSAAPQMTLAHQVAKPDSQEPALYVFNQEGGGWVIVSADDQSVSILGYSDKGTFDGTKENVAFMLDYYAKTIADAEPLSEEEKAQRKVSAPRRAKAETETPVAPLLEIEGIQWNQDSPWNDMCPIDRYDNSHSATGCVATAAAQVMRYWKWPAQGMGKASYTWTNFVDYDENVDKTFASFDTVLTADFGATTYNWDKMLPKYQKNKKTKEPLYTQEEAEAVAQFMYQVGVAAKMTYGGYTVGGSGASTHEAGKGMMNYFRYKSIGYHSQSNTFTVDSIAKYFSIDLHAKRPILMSGSPRSGHGSAHAFVCDGMDGEGLFHINWGWGGQSDGYFVLTTLDPKKQGIGGNTSSGGFGKDIFFMHGMEPDSFPTNVTNVTMDKSSITLKIKESKKLNPIITPANASSKAVYWTSSNDNIAIVSPNGIVRGVSAGTATITATTADGNLTTSCQVTVTNEVLPYVELSVNTCDAVEWGKGEKKDRWKITIYDSSWYPWLEFYLPGEESNQHIAGKYDLGNKGLKAWPSADDHDLEFWAKSGWVNLSCEGYHNGSRHGGNTYKIESEFIGPDGIKYYVQYTTELYYKDANKVYHPFDDLKGDGMLNESEVTWYAQGQEFASNTTRGKAIILPNGQPASCDNNRVFVGWCANEVDATNVKPALVLDGDAVNSNATYYAVFAEKTSNAVTQTETASVKFNKYSGDDDTSVSNLMDSLMAYDKIGINNITGTNTFIGAKGVKVGGYDQTGWITLTLNRHTAIKKVVIDAADYEGKDCLLRVIAGSTLVGSVQKPAGNMEFIARQPVVSNTIKVAVCNKEHFYISKISVIEEEAGSYINYGTSCSGSATGSVAPTNKEGLILIQHSMDIDMSETRQLIYTVTPYDTHDQSITCTSSNPDIATVDDKGYVTGKLPGSATITIVANDGGYSTTCDVNVSDRFYQNILKFTGIFENKEKSDGRASIGLSGEDSYPYMYFYLQADLDNKKLAGYYELNDYNSIEGWPTKKSPDKTIKSVSGWVNISCIKSGTYRIQSQFMGNDGLEYACDYTGDISAIGSKTLTDTKGAGMQDSVFFVAMGDTVFSTYIYNGTLKMPFHDPINCLAMSFVGWTTEESYNSDIAPTLAKEGDATSANSTYYAVFANPNGEAPFTQAASVVFKDMTNTKDYWYDDDYRTDNIENVMDSHSHIEAVHASYMRRGAHGIRIGCNANDEYGKKYGAHNGYIQLVTDTENTISKVVITSSKTYSDDLGEVYIDLGNVHDPNPISEGEDVVYIPTKPVTTNSIKLSTTKKAMYIKSVTVYTGGEKNYTGYTTTTCPETDIPHTIGTAIIGDGTITTGGITSAMAGETITITATPDHCYELETLSVKDADQNDVTVTDNTFVMPNSDVTISATFSILRYTITAEGAANGSAEVKE